MRLVRYLARTSGFGATLAGVLLMIGITVDVVVRGTTDASVPGLLQLNTFLLVVLAFLGLGSAEFSDSHMKMTLVGDRLPVRVRVGIRALTQLGVVAIIGWMFYASVLRAWDSYLSGESNFGVIEVPVWPMRAVLALGLVVMAVVSAAKAVYLAHSAITGGTDWPYRTASEDH